MAAQTLFVTEQRTTIRWLVTGAFLVITFWLAAAACAVKIEYYDGLSAIVNARYFLGTVDRYVADRAPLMALLLAPAELARTTLGLHALDVRPYHLELALLHVAYLFVSYRLLTQVFGVSWSVLAAWTAAVPNFIFVSYSPFVSHDIIPGVLLLCMLLWFDRFSRHRSLLLWTGLVALGAAAALVKQTFGVFWILLLLAGLFQWRISNGKEARTTFIALACGALASGGITWFVMGLLLRQADRSSPLLLRPLHNLQYLSNVYQGKEVTFPLWIYLRNAPAYGWLALVLVVPGWILSIRGTRIQQSIAIAWLGGLVFVHLLPLREVRYMAFLAPLTACLLVPVVQTLAHRKVPLAAALLLLAFDVGRCTLEAAQIFHPFYTSGIERRFFHLLDDPKHRNGPAFVNSPMMSFAAPIPSPLAADRYHRIFHFGVVHLRYIYDCQDLRVIADEQHALRAASTCTEGSLLFYSSQILARGPSWSARAPIADSSFTQSAAICRSHAVSLREATENGLVASETAAAVQTSVDDGGALIIQGNPCVESPRGELLPVVRFKSMEQSYWLRRRGRDSYAVLGMQPNSILRAQEAEIRRFEISHSLWTTGAK